MTARVDSTQPDIFHSISNRFSLAWEKGWLAIQIAAASVFSFISWWWPGLGDKLHNCWLGMSLWYAQVTGEQREGVLNEEIRRLQERIQTVAEKAEVLRVVNDRLMWEKRQAESDRAHVIEERERLIREKTQILQQLNDLRTEREQSAHHRAKTDAAAQQQLRCSERYDALNATLSRFHDLYCQMDPEGQQGATQLALEEMIPQYKAHRELLHEMLQTAIEALPESDDLLRLSLEGILRVSKQEIGHVERISEALHLLAELKPLMQSIGGTYDPYRN